MPDLMPTEKPPSISWTPEVQTIALRLRDQGKSIPVIAEILDVPEKSVKNFLYRVTSARPGYEKAARHATRPCLCCKRPFSSTGAGNRLCPECRGKAKDLSPYAP